MPKRSGVQLMDIASLSNLTLAYTRAARGKRRRTEVMRFEAKLWNELHALSEDIRDLRVSVGVFQSFRIFDPKPRTIHAPCFRERVLHHAMMAPMGPILDGCLVSDTFACRVGKGCLAAVERAEHHLRRFPVFVKIDIRRYFDSIHHDLLKTLLRRRFKDREVLALCERVIDAYEVEPGRGLPIGALTSQYFANTYLEPLDRFILQTVRARGMVRYMDDCAWWMDDLAAAKKSLTMVRSFVTERLKLGLHPKAYIQRSTKGLSFLGYRLFPGTRRLSRRRKQRYTRARQAWERAYQLGLIDAHALQRGYEGAWATTLYANSLRFRQAELARFGTVDA